MGKEFYYTKRIPRAVQPFFEQSVFKISISDVPANKRYLVKAYLDTHIHDLIHEVENNQRQISKNQLRDVMVRLKSIAVLSIVPELKAAILPDILAETTKSIRTLAEAEKHFIEMKKTEDGVGDASVKQYRASFQYLYLFFPPDTPVDSLTFQGLKKMRTTMLKFPPQVLKKHKDKGVQELLKMKSVERMNAKTINGFFTTYTNVFKMLVNDGIVKQNPLVNLQPLKTKRPDKKAFTPSDIAAIFENVTEKHVMDICAVGMYTGLRIGEIVSLRREDIVNGAIIVRDGKTSNAPRNIPIHPAIASIIEDAKNTGNEFLFYNGKVNAATKKMNRELNQIITDKSKSFHSLRKNFIQQMYNLFPDRETLIKYLVGHSNRKNITFDVYNQNAVNAKHMIEMIHAISYADAGATTATFSAA
jgi:integrase